MLRLIRLLSFALATLCLGAAGRRVVQTTAVPVTMLRGMDAQAVGSADMVRAWAVVTMPPHPDRPLRRARGTGPLALDVTSEPITVVSAFVEHATPRGRGTLQPSTGGALARSARAPPLV
jgi:hypothetical protein